MFKNYFVTALNNLLKNKLYSAINIAGLAVGLSACILITLYVQDELSYDKHWAKSESIYRLNMTFTVPGQAPITAGWVPGRALPALRSFFPGEFDAGSRILSLDVDIKIGNNSFNQEVNWVDQQFTELFDLEVTAGDLSRSLQNTNSIALSQDLAVRLFGNDSPIGEVFSLIRGESTKDYQVAAVYRAPKNSELSLPAITLLDENEFKQDPSFFNNWFSQSMHLYLLVENDLNRNRIESELANFTRQNIQIPEAFSLGGANDSSEVISFELQALTDIRLEGRTVPGVNGTRQTVLIFSSISVLVLLVGSINFMILTIARASQRSREVAMRKTLGAKRQQLIFQFLGESILLTLLATLIALALTETLMPGFGSFLEKELDIDYAATGTLLSLLTLVVGVGLIGGIYPAFVLSAYHPAHTLKSNRSSEAKGISFFRNALVIFQFTVSVSLIIATAVVYGQTAFSSNRDPGFNKNNLLVIEDVDRSTVNDRKDNLAQELATINAVSDVTLSSAKVMANHRNHLPVSPPADSQAVGNGAVENVSLLYVVVGHDFFETYQIPLLAGRYYSREFSSDLFPMLDGEELSSNVVVNESAVTSLGLGSAENALGKIIRSPRQTEAGVSFINLTIVGVAKDVQFLSVNEVPEPAFFPLAPDSDSLSYITLRYNGDSEQILREVTGKWDAVIGNEVLITDFIETEIDRQLQQTRTEATLLGGFSLLAISIACLGLFGVATFVVERRTKELGIRKVMGAKVKDIVYLLVWQFSKPVFFANLIAWPLSAWLMLNWLQRFPYQINNLLLIPFCIVAGVVTLSIAFLTVAGNTRKIARRSPIQALRYE